jgi:hypothetical protein
VPPYAFLFLCLGHVRSTAPLYVVRTCLQLNMLARLSTSTERAQSSSIRGQLIKRNVLTAEAITCRNLDLKGVPMLNVALAIHILAPIEKENNHRERARCTTLRLPKIQGFVILPALQDLVSPCLLVAPNFAFSTSLHTKGCTCLHRKHLFICPNACTVHSFEQNCTGLASRRRRPLAPSAVFLELHHVLGLGYSIIGRSGSRYG